MTNYVVVSSKNWFDQYSKSEQYKKLNITEISNKSDLNIEYLEKINPRYIFFPHWSWKVDSNIYKKFECVVFHTAPLPFGRGGSPIQNLIIRGIEQSPVCALRMTEVIDGGPIYDSMDISLKGKISEIFFRIAENIEHLIIKICQNNPEPKKQSGDVVLFDRLTYSDNEILNTYSLQEIYNRIRMVD
jgi:methionyl-tRNA formyltransferase